MQENFPGFSRSPPGLAKWPAKWGRGTSPHFRHLGPLQTGVDRWNSLLKKAPYLKEALWKDSIIRSCVRQVANLAHFMSLLYLPRQHEDNKEESKQKIE